MAGFSRLRRADRGGEILPLRGSSLVGPASLLLLVLSYWNVVRHGPEMTPAAARDGAEAEANARRGADERRAALRVLSGRATGVLGEPAGAAPGPAVAAQARPAGLAGLGEDWEVARAQPRGAVGGVPAAARRRRRRQRDDYARRRGPRDPDAGNPHGRRARPDVENDVASGLKWMLNSDPVVFMPRPTHETWAMEGLLRPYVHYVPVEADLPRSGRTRTRTGRARSRGGQRVREEALREPQGERRQRVDPPRDVPEVSGPVWRGAAEVPPPRYVWTIKTK